MSVMHGMLGCIVVLGTHGCLRVLMLALCIGGEDTQFQSLYVDQSLCRPLEVVTWTPSDCSTVQSRKPDSYRFSEYGRANNMFHTNHSQSVATLVIEGA